MNELSRQRYRLIKSFNREQMGRYFEEVFAAGYKAGKEAALGKQEPEKTENEVKNE